MVTGESGGELIPILEIPEGNWELYIGDLSDLFTSFSSLGVIPKITQANIQTSFRHVAVQELSELIFDKILQQAPLFPSLLHLQIFHCQHV